MVTATWFQRAKQWARVVKRDVIALWIASRDHRTPWYAKVVAAAIAAYALSPIDLIPDFIPLLGHLDDLVIVPVGILAAVALIPTHLMTDFREKAQRQADRPTSWFAAALIMVVWLIAILVVGAITWSSLSR